MKNVLWIALIIVILGGGYWWWEGGSSPATNSLDTLSDVAEVQQVPVAETASTTGVQAVSATNPDTAAEPVSGTYVMAQVTTHNSAASCWSVIDGNVYDLTKWIPQHPGGQQAIKGLCGKDGTAAFHGQHGDKKKQADLLATMKLGVLTQ